jgi:hypothetical protein
MKQAFDNMDKLIDTFDDAIDSLNLTKSKSIRERIDCDNCDEEGLYETDMNGHDVMCICNCGKYELLKTISNDTRTD